MFVREPVFETNATKRQICNFIRCFHALTLRTFVAKEKTTHEGPNSQSIMHVSALHSGNGRTNKRQIPTRLTTNREDLQKLYML